MRLFFSPFNHYHLPFFNPILFGTFYEIYMNLNLWRHFRINFLKPILYY